MESSYVADGKMLDYTPVADATAGDIVVVGATAGQVVSSVAANELGAIRIEGIVRLPKASAVVFTVGTETVDWDDVGKTAVEVGTFAVGKAVGGGANGQLFVDVLLNR